MACCQQCNRRFNSLQGLKEHYVQSQNHLYCQYCDNHFDDDDDFIDHGEYTHFVCRTCVKIFQTEARLHKHNDDRHYWCSPCDRIFQNENNLDQHLKSAKHKAANVLCPGANCGRGFVSVSALFSHFESGACHSGMTREELNRRVIQMDRNNVITNPARLVTGTGSHPQPRQIITQWATQFSWNGRAFECFLCHQEFHQLHSLNAHLQSPKHQDRIYRCPENSCRTEFNVLSALCQHVENGSCGVSRFRPVQRVMESIADGSRRIGY